MGTWRHPAAWRRRVVVVLDIERQRDAGEVGLRQVPQSEVVEVIIRVVEPEDCEVFGTLKDAGGHTGRACNVECCCGATAREGLQLQIAAGIEHKYSILRHLQQLDAAADGPQTPSSKGTALYYWAAPISKGGMREL